MEEDEAGPPLQHSNPSLNGTQLLNESIGQDGHERPQNQQRFKVMSKVIAQFMGLDSDSEEDDEDQVDGPSHRVFKSIQFPRSTQRRLWQNRRVRLANRRYGGIKDEYLLRDDHAAVQEDGDQVDGLHAALVLPVHAKPEVYHYFKDGLKYIKGRLNKGQKVIDLQTELNDVGTTVTDLSRSQEDFFDDKATKDVLDASSQVVPGRIPPERLQDLDDNSKRPYGQGFVGSLLNRQLVKSRQRVVRHQLDDLEDYRPNFTYWMTFVQIVVMVVTLALYGFAPMGLGMTQTVGFVMTSRLTLDQVSYREPANFWGGPRAADLIHLGAKYSPCMRYDRQIGDIVAQRRTEEGLRSGCCVRNDGSGCMQTTEEKCSSLLSTFHKWGYFSQTGLSARGPHGEVTGPVCGQDPRYCALPASRPPNEWPYDISAWPICRQATNATSLGAPAHLKCKLTARPCCIGIHGKCELRSQEYCRFVKGHFHPEATLCSQVDCMGDVCGMLSFRTKDSPDQIYRLWTALFLHAGLLHLMITCLVQWYLMRDLERLCGPVRTAVIYLGSGIVGNAASAVFVPHRAESGPAGAHYGLLAALTVEVINSWPMLKHPLRALGQLFGVLVVLIFVGFVPWVDNYAHLFGFIGGFLLSFVFMPYLSFGNFMDRPSCCSSFMFTKKGRLWIILMSASLFCALLASLLAVFYGLPDLNCEACKYLSCIPFTDTFCAEQNVDFERSPAAIF